MSLAGLGAQRGLYFEGYGRIAVRARVFSCGMALFLSVPSLQNPPSDVEVPSCPGCHETRRVREIIGKGVFQDPERLCSMLVDRSVVGVALSRREVQVFGVYLWGFLPGNMGGPPPCCKGNRRTSLNLSRNLSMPAASMTLRNGCPCPGKLPDKNGSGFEDPTVGFKRDGLDPQTQSRPIKNPIWSIPEHNFCNKWRCWFPFTPG